MSVIVRARDEEASLGRCLEPVRGQRCRSAEVELIVVDGGSRDRTEQIAADHGAIVLRLPVTEFSFGGALNLGAANARGDVLVALSADAFVPDQNWTSRLLAAFSDPEVACASGDVYGPDGEPLTGAVRQDIGLARRRPEWGYSNAAGAFRADLWRRRPFRGDLPGCEDKEWAWYWLQRGYRCLVDRSLMVAHDHSHDSLRSIFARARREAAGMAAFLEPTGERPYRAPELVREWWGDVRWYSSPARARLSHRRTARLLGAYSGRRQSPRRAATETGSAAGS